LRSGGEGAVRAAGDLAKRLSKAASEPAESGSLWAVPPLNIINNIFIPRVKETNL